MSGKRCLRYLLVMSATLTMVGSQSCDPDCSGQTPGTKVEDPRDCTRYYICMAGELPSDVPLPCPSGEEFVSGACQAPASGATPCSPSCSPTGCHLTCTSIGDHIADPFNCQAFYTCDIGGPGIVQFCPESIPYFDHSQQKCVNDESVCCSPSCEPYCDTNVIQIPDPTDCTKFYICDSAPIYPPFSCPPGEIFDIGIGHCSSAGECNVLCPSISPLPENVTNILTTTETTTATSTPSPSSPTAGGCLDQFQCEQLGFFPKCPSVCDPRYFYCDTEGNAAIEQRCSGRLVFNPNPDYPYCLQPDNCPYQPPF